MKPRTLIAIVPLLPLLVPLGLLGYCAGIIWASIYNGFLWAECDMDGKTPEEKHGSNTNDQ